MDVTESSVRLSIPENVILVDALCSVDETEYVPTAHRLLNLTIRARENWAHTFLMKYSGPESPLYRDQHIGTYDKANILYKRLSDPFNPVNGNAFKDLNKEKIGIVVSAASRKVITEALFALNEREDCHDILSVEDEPPAQQVVQPEDAEQQAIAEELIAARLERCFLLHAMIQDLDNFGH